MDSRKLRPMNHYSPSRDASEDDCQIVMSGVARTVQFTGSDDFLPVLRGLQEAVKDEILVVNTLGSTRAVAGEIFCAEACRKELAGIIIDGPVRDTRHLSKYAPVRLYATSSTPYSGTTQSVGEMQVTVTCAGVEVQPGDIVVGDEDGVLVGSVHSFEQILPIAQQIQQVEKRMLHGITSDSKKSISSMSNYKDHIEKRLQDKPSSLEFRV
mmetsp:Transcript_24556/g.43084  ORF Transcript_24556/g.43084 Transcript_24556/m.43084 type:complete len:211 (+) Transcript_24556:2-634(+)